MRREIGLLLLFVSACVSDNTVATDGGADGTAQDSGPKETGSDAPVVDTGGGGDVDSGPFTPAQLSNLALWLTADTAVPDVSSKVSTWTDQSTNHNDAKQTTEANAPFIGSVMINGHKTVHFDHTVPLYLTIADSPTMQWSQSFVLEVVVHHPPATGPEIGVVFAKKLAASPYQGPELDLPTLLSNPYTPYVTGQIENADNIGSSTTSAITDNAGHRLRMSWDGTNLSLQIDHNGPLTKPFTGVTNTGAPGVAAVLGSANGVLPFNGDIAEIVAIASATINPSDIASLETYLDTRYGL
jgi:hypothetical protein